MTSPAGSRAAALRLFTSQPRLPLAHLPTPIEALPRLSESIGGPALFVKRDDATGFGQGGNKVRALEYLLPDALAADADVLVTAGVTQSNSVRQVAAAAAKLGLDCHFAQITDRVTPLDPQFNRTGNALLTDLFGATSEPASIRTDRAALLDQIAHRLRAEGRRPYVIPYGCANRLGAIGYVNAALEIADQLAPGHHLPGTGRRLTHLLLPSGTGGTQAGLLVGFAALNLPIKVIGVDVDADPPAVRDRVATLVVELAHELELDPAPIIDNITIEAGFSAGGYGHADPATLDAVRTAAQLEGLTLDPVYTGKALAAVIGLTHTGHLTTADTVLVLHTGGAPALYAYRALFDTRPGHRSTSP
jgi:L-cysteate sulfo-lyase